MESYRKKIARVLTSQNTWVWILTGSSILFLVIYICFTGIVALQDATAVNTYGANGTFQLYNPLRRLSEGQIAGVDFPFFHGVGVILLHFPVFVIFGENLFAAEVAKQLVSPALFFASSWFFMYAVLQKHRQALIATALATIICIFFSVTIIGPGNSLVGVRSTLPIIVAGLIAWPLAKTGRTRLLQKILLVAALALSIICGSEQGIAAVLSFLLIKCIFAAYRKTPVRHILQNSLTQICAIGIMFIVLLALVTAGNPAGALRYAFIDIPADQGWYFGTEPNGTLTWDNLLPLLFNWSLRYMHLIILSTLVLLWIAQRRKLLQDAHKMAFLFLGTSGVLVAVFGALGGYYEPHMQLLPLLRSAVLIASVLIVWLVLVYPKSVSANVKWSASKNWIGIGLYVVLCAITLYYATLYVKLIEPYKVHETLSEVRRSRHAPDYEVSSLGWQAGLDKFLPLIKPDKTVWSMYTSVYDSSLGQVNPSSGGEDYIIHALGKERRENYTSSFIETAPDYVITLRPLYFRHEEWLWDRHWPIYEHLLSHYTLVESNGSHFLWQLQDKPGQQMNEQQVEVRSDNGRYYLPRNTSNKPQIYSVRMSYAASSGLHINALDKIPRYLLSIRGVSATQYPVSLPSYEKTWTFPVIAMPGEQPHIEQKVIGVIPTAKLQIQKVEASEFTTADQNLALFYDNICFMQHITELRDCHAVEQTLHRNKPLAP
jgi:hypothetical protein